MKINLLTLENINIYDQLKIEEALLRLSDENWFIINHGSKPSIVLGISNTLDEIHLQKAKNQNIDIIKRFSGGGTVFIDQDTITTSFIISNNSLNFNVSTDAVFKWIFSFFKPIFKPVNIDLIENDFVIDNKKFAGNAQYLTKNRLVHHTSFLWDYNKEFMNTLPIPKKIPKYRNNRKHDDFLTKINSCFSSQNEFINRLLNNLDLNFLVKKNYLNEIKDLLETEHRRNTLLITTFLDK